MTMVSQWCPFISFISSQSWQWQCFSIVCLNQTIFCKTWRDFIGVFISFDWTKWTFVMEQLNDLSRPHRWRKTDDAKIVSWVTHPIQNSWRSCRTCKIKRVDQKDHWVCLVGEPLILKLVSTHIFRTWMVFCSSFLRTLASEVDCTFYRLKRV